MKYMMANPNSRITTSTLIGGTFLKMETPPFYVESERPLPQVRGSGHSGLDGSEFDLLQGAQGRADRFDLFFGGPLLFGRRFDEALRFGQLSDDLAQGRLDGVDFVGHGAERGIGLLVFAGGAVSIAVAVAG